MFHCSHPFSVDFLEFFIEMTTFEEFEEIHYNDEKEIIDSNIDLLRKFQLKNVFLNIYLVYSLFNNPNG